MDEDICSVATPIYFSLIQMLWKRYMRPKTKVNLLVIDENRARRLSYLHHPTGRRGWV